MTWSLTITRRRLARKISEHLASQGHRSSPMSALAKRIGVSHPTVTKAIDPSQEYADRVFGLIAADYGYQQSQTDRLCYLRVGTPPEDVSHD